MVLNVVVGVVMLLELVIIWLLLTRNLTGRFHDFIAQQCSALEKGQERIEKAMRDEMARMREETAKAAQLAREDLAARFRDFRELAAATLDQQGRDAARRDDTFQQAMLSAVRELSQQQKGLLDSFARQLTALTQLNDQKLDKMRETVEQRLTAMQQDNGVKLEQMRATVDEKLHQTLERRLGESFKLVTERLELVHKGLGEMQTLASGVGDLKKVLGNVKARGTLGEIQLEALLEQTLSPGQYRQQVEVRGGSGERVDFAIVLPGRDDSAHTVLLPVDAKFPLEDYQHLTDAQEAGDAAQAAEAGRSLEARIKAEAKSIREKYLHPPATTDFAILFLPVEGLFAEILRRPGLWDLLQREYRVVVTGPTTITALLNSLQMGFRTLAIQKRSSEVWKLLGAIKTEFGRFGDLLDKTRKKLQEASNTIDGAAVRSRAIERQLRQVEAAPAAERPALWDDMASGSE